MACGINSNIVIISLLYRWECSSITLSGCSNCGIGMYELVVSIGERWLNGLLYHIWACCINCRSYGIGCSESHNIGSTASRVSGRRIWQGDGCIIGYCIRVACSCRAIVGIGCTCCWITQCVGGCQAPNIGSTQGVLHCLPLASRYHQGQCARLIRLELPLCCSPWGCTLVLTLG